jgi:hypothetical protein
VRAKVRVRAYPGGKRAIFHRPRRLARRREDEPTVEPAIPSALRTARTSEQVPGIRTIG